MKTKKSISPALAFITHCWDGVPRRSWRNRNVAMHQAMKIAITSGMPFDPNDVKTISGDYAFSRWCGDGENFYSLACEAASGSNIPAAVALEQWFGRPAYLWAERTKIAERLHIGSEFTWSGHRVTVTSFAKDGKSLTACTYKDRQDYNTGNKIGAVSQSCPTDDYSTYRRIEAITVADDSRVMVPYSAVLPEGNQSRSIARRFKVPFDELMAARTAYDQRRKDYVKQLESACTMQDWQQVNARFIADGPAAFRHFDVEEIQDAARKAHGRIREGMSDDEVAAYKLAERTAQEKDLKRWMDGEPVHRSFPVVRLRVKDGWVETTTNQRATVKGARAALAFAKPHRKKGWHANGTSFDLDALPLRSITAKGVQVGCTFIEWTEIDRIAPLLK